MAGKIAKRAFDILFSFFALIISAPFIVVFSVYAVIRGRSPFYLKYSAGLDGQAFHVIKLTTMGVSDGSFSGDTFIKSITKNNDPRVTRSGYYLRKYKIDELPQFINVLMGQMSVVGPRPLSITKRQQFNGIDKIIFSVKPGVTGVGSLYFVNEQYLLTGADTDVKQFYIETIIPKKIVLERWYVQNQSLFVDLCIVGATIVSIVSGGSALSRRYLTRLTGGI